LTTADYEEYREKFEASGLSQSEFFRRYVLTNATTVMARNGPAPDYKNALRLLHAAGNNLNQIAHRMNSEHLEGKLKESSYSRILAELQMLRAFMNGVIKDAD
jgi:lysyl-tRNA synthetase class I